LVVVVVVIVIVIVTAMVGRWCDSSAAWGAKWKWLAAPEAGAANEPSERKIDSTPPLASAWPAARRTLGARARTLLSDHRSPRCPPATAQPVRTRALNPARDKHQQCNRPLGRPTGANSLRPLEAENLIDF